MGDTKKLRKKFETPRHPWNATRISLEKNIMRKYGVANKKEIWRMESVLKRFKDQAKSLLTRTDDQANKERKQMIARIVRLGLANADAGVDDVLGLQLKDVMDRRLQTIVLKNRMARSVKHARQMITHEHILVGGTKVTSPSYLVPAAEESTIAYASSSPFIRTDHPEAFDEEIAQQRAVRQRAKADKKGEEFDEIVLFDAIEDLDDVKKDSVDASVQDLNVDDEKAPAKDSPKQKPAVEPKKEESTPVKESPVKEAPVKGVPKSEPEPAETKGEKK